MSAPATTLASAPHLDPQPLAELRQLLVSARRAQELAVEDDTSTASELTGHGDVDSRLERELAESSAARAREQLVEIDAALARIDAGTYGRCESCGLPIARERLEVIPQARHCVACSAGV